MSLSDPMYDAVGGGVARGRRAGHEPRRTPGLPGIFGEPGPWFVTGASPALFVPAPDGVAGLLVRHLPHVEGLPLRAVDDALRLERERIADLLPARARIR